MPSKESGFSYPATHRFLSLAATHLREDRIEEAIAVLAEGLQGCPDSVAGHHLLGKLYFQKGQLSEARLEFEQVLSVNPESIPALKKMATILDGERQFKEAAAACVKVLMIDPHDQEGKWMLSVFEEKISASSIPEVPDMSSDLPLPEGVSSEEGAFISALSMGDSGEGFIPLWSPPHENGKEAGPPNENALAAEDVSNPMAAAAQADCTQEKAGPPSAPALPALIETPCLPVPPAETQAETGGPAPQSEAPAPEPLSPKAQRVKKLTTWLHAIQKKRHLDRVA